MLEKFFKKKKKENNDSKNILIAALLIHAAKIDNNYTINEYSINSQEADELLKVAEAKEHESNQILEFTREIKNKSMEFRLKIIEILWKIVYSDGTSDNYESNLIRRLCGLLYISDKDSGMIKLKVQNLKNNL